MNFMIGDNYIFIDIPKTGTTAIISYLTSKIGGEGPLHDHIPLNCYVDIFGPEVLDKYIFTVMRNPYSRLVSIWKYYNKLKHRYFEIDPSVPSSKDDPHRLDVIEYLKRIPCFDAYIEDILSYNPPKNFKERTQYENCFPWVDVIKKSQWAMIKNPDLLNRAIDFDNFDEGWKLVCQDMGWEYEKLPLVNTSGGPNWETFYSNKQIDDLREVILPDLQIWNHLKNE